MKKLKMKPRAEHLHDILSSKKGGKHEAKTGPLAKRAKQKQQLRKELMDA